MTHRSDSVQCVRDGWELALVQSCTPLRVWAMTKSISPKAFDTTTMRSDRNSFALICPLPARSLRSAVPVGLLSHDRIFSASGHWGSPSGIGRTHRHRPTPSVQCFQVTAPLDRNLITVVDGETCAIEPQQ